MCLQLFFLWAAFHGSNILQGHQHIAGTQGKYEKTTSANTSHTATKYVWSKQFPFHGYSAPDTRTAVSSACVLHTYQVSQSHCFQGKLQCRDIRASGYTRAQKIKPQLPAPAPIQGPPSNLYTFISLPWGSPSSSTSRSQQNNNRGGPPSSNTSMRHPEAQHNQNRITPHGAALHFNNIVSSFALLDQKLSAHGSATLAAQ